jgi:threonine dehydrogenase-like Zn-dependent dehydrogenase
MGPGTVLGHEGVGIVEELGSDVRNLAIGDRVVIASTIGCGNCSYCRADYYAPGVTRPTRRRPRSLGDRSSLGRSRDCKLSAPESLLPNVGLVKLPEEVTDDQAILLSDIFRTAYFGPELAEIKNGNSVAVFGCGPVGQFAIASAKLRGAGRVFAIDSVDDRLGMAREQGAETIHFNQEDPVDTLRHLTGGIGPDRVIGAIGVDATTAHEGPAAQKAAAQRQEFEQEKHRIAGNGGSENWGSRRCAVPGAAMVRGRCLQSRNRVDHRRVSASSTNFSHWPGDE